MTDVDRLFREYHHRVLGMLQSRLRKAPPEDVEELAADVFVRAHKAAARFNGKNEYAWLMTIARNMSVDYIRRRNAVRVIRPFSMDLAADMATAASKDAGQPASPDDLFRAPMTNEDEALWLRIEAAIAELSPMQRRAMEAYLELGERLPPSMAALGLSKPALKSTRERAFVNLRRKLKGAA